MIEDTNLNPKPYVQLKIPYVQLTVGFGVLGLGFRNQLKMGLAFGTGVSADLQHAQCTRAMIRIVAQTTMLPLLKIHLLFRHCA